MNNNQKKYKLFIILLTAFLVNSCCVIPSFLDKKYIDYKCNSVSLSDTDFELALLDNGRATKRMDLFQLFYADTTAHIDVSKWKVFNGNKSCKIRHLKIVDNNKWKKISNRKVYGLKLLLLSFKSKVEVGDTIKIIEEDFPGNDNYSIVSIKIPELMNSSGFHREGSPIGRMLPKVR